MKENQLTRFEILMIFLWVHLINIHYGVLKIECVMTFYSMIGSVHYAVLCMKPSDFALKNTLNVSIHTCWQALRRVHYTRKGNIFEAMPNTLDWHVSPTSAPSELKSTRRLRVIVLASLLQYDKSILHRNIIQIHNSVLWNWKFSLNVGNNRKYFVENCQSQSHRTLLWISIMLWQGKVVYINFLDKATHIVMDCL